MPVNYTPLDLKPERPFKKSILGLVGGVFVLMIAMSVGIYMVNKPQDVNIEAQLTAQSCPEGEYNAPDASTCNQDGGTVSSFINSTGVVSGDGASGGTQVCCRRLTVPSVSSCPEGSVLKPIDQCPGQLDSTVKGDGSGMVCCPTTTPEITPGVTPDACGLLTKPEVVNVIVKCPDCSQ